MGHLLAHLEQERSSRKCGAAAPMTGPKACAQRRAVSGAYTRTGGTFAGQNADLSGGIEQFAAVLTFAVTGKPAVMMLVPAGQISYLGISSEGLSADANFLRSGGWRTGFPR